MKVVPLGHPNEQMEKGSHALDLCPGYSSFENQKPCAYFPSFLVTFMPSSMKTVEVLKAMSITLYRRLSHDPNCLEYLIERFSALSHPRITKKLQLIVHKT